MRLKQQNHAIPAIFIWLTLTTVVLSDWVAAKPSLIANVSPGVAEHETLVVPYKQFYQHVRRLDPEEHPDLQMVFGFAHQSTQQMCKIKRAFIHTAKQDIPLPSIEHRFAVPRERALLLAEAVVTIDFQHAKQHCNISVLLKAKLDKWSHLSFLSADALRDIDRQFQHFFENVGSFLTFLVPKTLGIKLHFSASSTEQAMSMGVPSTAVTTSVQGAIWHLSRSWLQHNETALVSKDKVRYVSAWVN